VRRALVAGFVVSALLVVGCLAVVGLRVQQVHLAYQLERLHRERAEMGVVLRQLEVEVATLQAPGRVEQRARQLGWSRPTARRSVWRASTRRAAPGWPPPTRAASPHCRATR